MGPADTWDTMGDWLRGVATTLDREPSAIVVVSAHWESELVSVTSSAQPTLLYDYYGFPEQTYEIRYDVQGSPKLANEIRALLEEAGIATTSDPERGLDHGVFVPLKLMFPSATIPSCNCRYKRCLSQSCILKWAAR